MSLCGWFHIKTGNVYPAGDYIYSACININRYFRNVLELVKLYWVSFLMTYTALLGIQ